MADKLKEGLSNLLKKDTGSTSLDKLAEVISQAKEAYAEDPDRARKVAIDFMNDRIQQQNRPALLVALPHSICMNLICSSEVEKGLNEILEKAPQVIEDTQPGKVKNVVINEQFDEDEDHGSMGV